MTVALTVVLWHGAVEAKLEGSDEGEDEDLHLGRGHLLAGAKSAVRQEGLADAQAVFEKLSVDKTVETKLLQNGGRS